MKDDDGDVPLLNPDADHLGAVFGERPSWVSDWTQRRAVWTASEIARELGCDARTVRRWCEDGVLKAERPGDGGHFRVTGDDLRTYLNGHSKPVAA